MSCLDVSLPASDDEVEGACPERGIDDEEEERESEEENEVDSEEILKNN